jgi:nitrilase
MKTINQTTLRVATAQVTPFYLNKEQTIKKACDVIIEAGNNGAKLIVFPEAFVSGYPDWVWLVPNYKGDILNKLYVELLNNSISVPDKFTVQLCKAAKQANIFVSIGINERNSEASNSTLYDSILSIDADGEIVGTHRKVMPTGGERLVWGQGDGSTIKSYNTEIGKIGGLVCWENYMPLARQALYNKGVQILTALTWDKSDNWLISLQHIAREGGIFLISCCTPLRIDDIPDKYDFKQLYPEGREWINTGNSCIISPKGEIIAGPIKEKEEIIYADLDLSQISEAKRMFDAAGHYSRSELFEFNVKNEAH